MVCKHLYAIRLSKELRPKLVSDSVIQSSTIPLSDSIECSKCKSSEIDGRGFNKSGLIQNTNAKALITDL